MVCKRASADSVFAGALEGSRLSESDAMRLDIAGKSAARIRWPE
jgi:hypothetical protein